MGQDESAIIDDSVAPRSLSARSLSAVAEYINSGGKKKKIVVLTGAGISTAAGSMLRSASTLRRTRLTQANSSRF